MRESERTAREGAMHEPDAASISTAGDIHKGFRLRKPSLEFIITCTLARTAATCTAILRVPAL